MDSTTRPDQSNGRDTLQLAKKTSRGRDSISDASSVLATDHATPEPTKICHNCRQLESSSKPFIRCQYCQRAFHLPCHSPAIQQVRGFSSLLFRFEGDRGTFKKLSCRKCQKDRKRKSSISTTTCSIPNCDKAAQSSQSSLRPLCSQHELEEKDIHAQNKVPKTCAFPNCKAVIEIFKMSSSEMLCQIHKSHVRFQKALDQKKAPPDIPTQQSKPFKKAKLYTVRPEDREVIKAKRSKARDSQMAQESQSALQLPKNTPISESEIVSKPSKDPANFLTKEAAFDEEMTDAQCIEFGFEVLDNEESLVDAATLKLPSTVSLYEDFNNGKPSQAEWSTAVPTNSIEYRRAQKAANYDPTELDKWLAKEPTLPTDIQPTAQELVTTQVWGHIDPRILWPPEFSEEWLKDKCEEINARGGRKANYGKVITAQNRKEREGRGWSIHQCREAKPLTDERREVMRKVDELFRVKDVDGMVPQVRNGVLYMVDPPEGQGSPWQESGRSDKNAPRAFRVG